MRQIEKENKSQWLIGLEIFVIEINRNRGRYLLQKKIALQWRHNESDSVSNHQPRDCLLSRLIMRRSKKISKLCVTGLCVGNSPVTGEFPARMASNVEYVSIWWRHHGIFLECITANISSVFWKALFALKSNPRNDPIVWTDIKNTIDFIRNRVQCSPRILAAQSWYYSIISGFSNN